MNPVIILKRTASRNGINTTSVHSQRVNITQMECFNNYLFVYNLHWDVWVTHNLHWGVWVFYVSDLESLLLYFVKLVLYKNNHQHIVPLTIYFE